MTLKAENAHHVYSRRSVVTGWERFWQGGDSNLPDPCSGRVEGEEGERMRMDQSGNFIMNCRAPG